MAAINKVMEYTLTAGRYVLDVGQPDYATKCEIMIPRGHLGRELHPDEDTDFVAELYQVTHPGLVFVFGGVVPVGSGDLHINGNNVSVGDGSGSPTQTFDKEETGNSALEFTVEGAPSKRIVHSTTEALSLRSYDSSVWYDAIRVINADQIVYGGSSSAVHVFNGAIEVGSNGGPRLSAGSGTPEGAVTAVVGSLFTRTDGGAGTTLYVKESGTGNTGWVAK